MNSFEELVTARKSWIADILKPWCQTAKRKELLKAETEWLDIAGKVAVEKTLWLWAWSRFPELVHETLGIEETSEVHIELNDGRKFAGFPDSRLSQQGKLVVWGRVEGSDINTEQGPFSIDDVVTIERASSK